MAEIFLMLDKKVITIFNAVEETRDITIHLTHKYANGDYGVKLSKKKQKELVKLIVENL